MTSTIYIPNSIPVKGVTFSFYIALISQADTDIFQVNPTLAVGDFKISIDGGALNNITTLPTVVGATKMVLVSCSAAEMNGYKICFLGSDVAGAQWQDVFFEIPTYIASGNVYIPSAPMLKNAPFTYYLSLISQADTSIFQANPTFAAGDAKSAIDGGGFANFATLPVSIAASKIVAVTHSAAEMNGNKIVDIFSDAAGNEWQDSMLTIDTESAATDSPTTGSTINMVCGITFSQTLTGLTIPATWTKIYLTVKKHMEDADPESVLQLLVTNPPNAAADGIVYHNGSAATGITRAHGTLTVTQGAGSIAVLVKDEGTVLLPAGEYGYDLKCLLADGSTTQLSSGGECNVSWTESRS